MDIDEANTSSKQAVEFDYVAYLRRPCDLNSREQVEIGKRLLPFGQIAESQFCDDKRMDDDSFLPKQVSELGVSTPEVIDPD
jgi:hypothetical protein